MYKRGPNSGEIINGNKGDLLSRIVDSNDIKAVGKYFYTFYDGTKFLIQKGM